MLRARSPLHILVAPLDWGLGHTSRCVPLIRHLLANDHRVTAAGTKTQRSFYQQTFPEESAAGSLRLKTLEGYDVRYSTSGSGFLPRIVQQVPRILRTVRAEHRWLEALLKEERIAGVLSDNRYGLHHPRVPAIMLTHQLSPRTGMGPVMDGLVRRLHYRALQKFDACWIVDVASAPGLCGTLAHPSVLPANAAYIGLLSQFPVAKQVVAEGADGPLLILLSGPEPQRTLLSKKLWSQALEHKGRIVFVEGREDAPVPHKIPTHITHHRRLTAGALKPLLEEASVVICRSGYSTLMDLVALRKRAVIIPTPGQTEQEYLAKMLAASGTFATARQEDFSLDTALSGLGNMQQKRRDFSAEDFQAFIPVLENWLANL